MNCKPGDLAIVVRGIWENLGRIVSVDRWAEKNTFTPPGMNANNAEAGWVCHGRIVGRILGGARNGQRIEVTAIAIPDEALRPLRDNDEVDETLRNEYTKGAL